MKIKDGYVLNNVAGKNVILYMGEDENALNGMIQVNEIGAFIWDGLLKEYTKEQLLDSVLKEYDVDRDTALKDIEKFLDILTKENVIE